MAIRGREEGLRGGLEAGDSIVRHILGADGLGSERNEEKGEGEEDPMDVDGWEDEDLGPSGAVDAGQEAPGERASDAAASERSPGPGGPELEEGELGEVGLSQSADGALKSPRTPTSRGTRKGKRKHSQKVDMARFVQCTCKRLGEAKVSLVWNAVHKLGMEAFQQLLCEVYAIEQCGGQLTADGKRRRTAGGVLWNIVKARVPPDVYKQIMSNEKEIQKKKEKERQHKKAKREVRRSADQISGPALPLEHILGVCSTTDSKGVAATASTMPNWANCKGSECMLELQRQLEDKRALLVAAAEGTGATSGKVDKPSLDKQAVEPQLVLDSVDGGGRVVDWQKGWLQAVKPIAVPILKANTEHEDAQTRHGGPELGLGASEVHTGTKVLGKGDNAEATVRKALVGQNASENEQTPRRPVSERLRFPVGYGDLDDPSGAYTVSSN